MKTQKKENTKVANMECSTNMARDDTCGRPPQLSNIQFTHILGDPTSPETSRKCRNTTTSIGEDKS